MELGFKYFFFKSSRKISVFTTIPTPRRRWKAHSGFFREDLQPQTEKAPKIKGYKIRFAKACIKYTKGVSKTAIINFTL